MDKMAAAEYDALMSDCADEEIDPELDKKIRQLIRELLNLKKPRTMRPVHLSVSYTHLDVYKRQLVFYLSLVDTGEHRSHAKHVFADQLMAGIDIAIRSHSDVFRADSASFMALIPVSYTHLDVYKRQPFFRFDVTRKLTRMFFRGLKVH